MKLRKGLAAALAVCVLGSTAGCNREEPIDTSAIETIPARFIDALATDNASAMISITRDYDYAEDTEGIRLGMGDYYGTPMETGNDWCAKICLANLMCGLCLPGSFCCI